MKKNFNDVGLCIPREHYIVYPNEIITKYLELIQQQKYLVINNPPQSGTTTILGLLENKLKNNDFFPIYINFVGYDSEVFQNKRYFLNEFCLSLISQLTKQNLNDEIKLIRERLPNLKHFGDLSRLISKLCKARKGLVLIIDEIATSMDNQLIFDFLGMLREKYNQQRLKEDSSFHSVILSGMHLLKFYQKTVKSIRKPKYYCFESISINNEYVFCFNKFDIAEMLYDYAEATTLINLQKIPEFAEKIHFFTAGHPYLVSKICKIIDEEIFPKSDRKEWRIFDIYKAVKRLISSEKKDTFFQLIYKSIENDVKLFNLVEKTILGEKHILDTSNSVINDGIAIGLFKANNHFIRIHNPIYTQKMIDFIVSPIDIDFSTEPFNFINNFITDENELDLSKILVSFQKIVQQEFSKKFSICYKYDRRLLFLTFLKNIMNGEGLIITEVQLSEEKRINLKIVFDRQEYVVELKKWCGNEQHERSLNKFCDYLSQEGLEKGYLVIFDDISKEKEYEEKEILLNSKEILWVRV